MSEEKGNAPIQTLRDGAVVVKLWQQDGPKGPFVTATLGRTYKDNETGEYGESRSLSGSDVLKGHALLLDAHREMGRWREYFNEVAPQPEEKPTQGLSAQRDEVLAQAKPPQRDNGPDRIPER